MVAISARWTVGLAMGFLALNALVAGALFVAAPDGSLLGMGEDLLDGSPFGNYLVPGLALLALGIGALVATLVVARGHRLAAPVTLGVAACFVVYEAVQLVVVGPVWLQAVVTVLALLAAAFALPRGALVGPKGKPA